MSEMPGPDKGRAWVVAFSACIINMILSGISRMVGILYVAVIDVYGVSRQEATMPFSVRNSVRSLSGPLVGLVGQLCGIKAITFGGGIIASLGACLCSIAPSVTWLTVLWGGVHGFGFAFANTLFQVVVNQYFDKYRTTASGIALSGACLGSLVFPIMFETFLDAYGLHGAFLMLGGVVLHVLPASLLLSTPPWVKKITNAEKADERNGSTYRHREGSTRNSEPPKLELSSDFCRSTCMSNSPLEGVHLVKLKRYHSCTPDYSIRPRAAKQQADEDKANSTQIKQHKSSDADSIASKCQEDKTAEKCATASVLFTVEHAEHRNGGMAVEMENHREGEGHAPMANGHENANESPKGRTKLTAALFDIAALYRNPVYLLISVCMSVYVIIFIPILTVIIDYGKDKGLQEGDGKYLINVMALGDLLGRLCFGWVTDKGYMSVANFMLLAQALQGAFIIGFPWARDLYGLMALLALYGMMAGSILVLMPILVYKYLPEDQQPIAMGCVGFISGMVTFSLPPLIGHFRDSAGSYDGMFLLTGSISIVSGGMWLFEPILVKRQASVHVPKERT